MDANQLSAASGVILSLLCSYLPGIKSWYGNLPGDVKSLVMLVLLAMVSVGVYVLSCSGWASWVTCDKAGVQALIGAFISALVANQATYVITPKQS